MPTQTSVLNTLMDAMADQLELKLLTELEGEPVPADEGIAGLVRKGKLQDDPTTYIVSILIHPTEKDYPHTIWDPRFVIGFKLPNVYEIGGPYPVGFWVRRFRVELKMFFDGEIDREIAQVKGNLVLSRATHAVLTMPLGTIPTDSFGETVNAVQVVNGYIREGGGPGTFIWRGEVLVEFLTQIDPT